VNERRIPDPVLLASELRVDVEGVPGCEGLSFRTKGEKVLVLGAPRALFLAATGLLPAVAGAITVRGLAPNLAVGQGVIAGAALDPPLPPRWTVKEYVTWSARLSGAPGSEAGTVAEGAIDRLKLTAMAKTTTDKLVPHARRATVVAAALATGAEVIALEDPLAGLPEEIQTSYGAMLLEALADRAWLVFAARMPITSPIARAAEDALVLTASRVEGQGAPSALAAAEGVRFVARLDGVIGPVRDALAARGASLEEQGAHVLLDLHSVTTSELAQICATANVAILELAPVGRPIARAFL
jgi:ABC-2 type transport system ATP-binding protein